MLNRFLGVRDTDFSVFRDTDFCSVLGLIGQAAKPGHSRCESDGRRPSFQLSNDPRRNRLVSSAPTLFGYSIG